jgi:hypothetical protein
MSPINIGNRTSRLRKAQTRPATGVCALAGAPSGIGANLKDKKKLLADS